MCVSSQKSEKSEANAVAPKRHWERVAEQMLRRNKIKKGLLVEPSEKERYARKAYRLLLLMHASSYWAEEGIPGERPGYRPGVRERRRKIRQYCDLRAREIIRPCVTVKEHKQAIKDLQERAGNARPRVKKEQPQVEWSKMTEQEQRAEIRRLKGVARGRK